MGYCNLCGKQKKTQRVNAFGQELIQSSMTFSSDLYVCDYCKDNFMLMKAKYDLSTQNAKLETIKDFLDGRLDDNDRYNLEEDKEFVEDRIKYLNELISKHENT